MSADWNGWAQAWQAETDGAASDVEAIERRVRAAQGRQRLRTTLDLLACALAVAVSLWAVADGSPPSVVIGLAGLAFAFFGLAVTLGRRRTPGALASRTVTAALGWEIATARSAARTSVGAILVSAGSLAFLAVCTVVFQRVGILGHGLTMAMLCTGLAYALGSALTSWWLLRRRRARVAQLEALLTDLTDEA